jgi:hypothetical protein
LLIADWISHIEPCHLLHVAFENIKLSINWDRADKPSFSYFVKPESSTEDNLSEETAGKLAIGYRKLIKISTESDKKELQTMVENFELRYHYTLYLTSIFLSLILVASS